MAVYRPGIVSLCFLAIAFLASDLDAQGFGSRPGSSPGGMRHPSSSRQGFPSSSSNRFPSSSSNRFPSSSSNRFPSSSPSRFPSSSHNSDPFSTPTHTQPNFSTGPSGFPSSSSRRSSRSQNQSTSSSTRISGRGIGALIRIVIFLIVLACGGFGGVAAMANRNRSSRTAYQPYRESRKPSQFSGGPKQTTGQLNSNQTSHFQNPYQQQTGGRPPHNLSTHNPSTHNHSAPPVVNPPQPPSNQPLSNQPPSNQPLAPKQDDGWY